MSYPFANRRKKVVRMDNSRAKVANKHLDESLENNVENLTKEKNSNDAKFRHTLSVLERELEQQHVLKQMMDSNSVGGEESNSESLRERRTGVIEPPRNRVFFRTQPDDDIEEVEEESETAAQVRRKKQRPMTVALPRRKSPPRSAGGNRGKKGGKRPMTALGLTQAGSEGHDGQKQLVKLGRAAIGRKYDTEQRRKAMEERSEELRRQKKVLDQRIEDFYAKLDRFICETRRAQTEYRPQVKSNYSQLPAPSLLSLDKLIT